MKNKILAGVIATLFLFMFGFYCGVLYCNRDAHITVSQTTPETRTVIVEKPIITERVVKQLVENPNIRKEVNQLLAENAQLRAKVTELTITQAKSESHGGGIVAVEPVSTQPAVVQYRFKDWRLDFKTDTKTASYTLDQKFEIIQTTGRDKEGNPLALVKLFEIDEDQQRMLIPAYTTNIVADQTSNRWHTGIRVQAGLVSAVGVSGKAVTTGAVGVQWLVRGRADTAEDSTLAIATPVVTAEREIGVLPIQYNLGQAKGNPLNDVWVGVYFGADIRAQRVSKIGIAFTSTF